MFLPLPLQVSNILNSLSMDEVCARSGTDLVAFQELDAAIMRLQDAELAAEKATKQAKRKVGARERQTGVPANIGSQTVFLQDARS
mgnify:CR=1 FL=1